MSPWNQDTRSERAAGKGRRGEGGGTEFEGFRRGQPIRGNFGLRGGKFWGLVGIRGLGLDGVGIKLGDFGEILDQMFGNYGNFYGVVTYYDILKN